VKPEPLCANKDARRRVKKELASHLEFLAGCCQPLDAQRWPSPYVLESVEHFVMSLIATERTKGPSPAWKAFRSLRERKLAVASHVNSLVKRARRRLEEAGESMLTKLARREDGADKRLLNDIERLRGEGLSKANEIEWELHENALRRYGLEPACGNSGASQRVTCYTRALELLIDDYQREPLRRKSAPLLDWLTRIGHPEANSLLALDYTTERALKRKEDARREEKASRLRMRRAERMGWYRQDKKWIKWRYHSKSVIYRAENGEHVWNDSFTESRKIYPGGWVCIQVDDGFIGAERIPNPPVCQFCRTAESWKFWLFNLASNMLRCGFCQSQEWISRGYDLDGEGLAIWSHSPNEIGPRG